MENFCKLGVLNHFREIVPTRPHVSEDLTSSWRQSKSHALHQKYIQFTPRNLVRAMAFDIDHAGACSADHDGILPPANLKIINQKNGHGHAIYFLKAPVATSSAARLAPLKFLASIELGIRRRLEADPNYAGYLVKNPMHQEWHTMYGSITPYSLKDLSDWLHRPDLRHPGRKLAPEGFGRNVTVFDELRAIAYREVRTFKKNDEPRRIFEARLVMLASGINMQFPSALPFSEVRSISRSVSKWVWKNFNEAKFSEVQRRRGKQGMDARWKGHISAEATKPWDKEGISRRTYYRRKKKALCTKALP